MHGFSFELAGELGHFRNLFTQSFLETMTAPPKTTVSGIIGAALGYNEKETVELNKKILVGVKVLNISGFIKEITTFFNQKVKPYKSTPIMREILVRPRYKIYIATEEESVANKMMDAIKHPRYPLYMGNSDFLAYSSNISKEMFTEENNKIFDCILPYKPFMSYTIRLKGAKEGVLIPPKVYRVPTGFTFAKHGRTPEDLMDLLMFFGYYVELKEPIKSYVTGNKEAIALI